MARTRHNPPKEGGKGKKKFGLEADDPIGNLTQSEYYRKKGIKVPPKDLRHATVLERPSVPSAKKPTNSQQNTSKVPMVSDFFAKRFFNLLVMFLFFLVHLQKRSPAAKRVSARNTQLETFDSPTQMDSELGSQLDLLENARALLGGMQSPAASVRSRSRQLHTPSLPDPPKRDGEIPESCSDTVDDDQQSGSETDDPDLRTQQESQKKSTSRQASVPGTSKDSTDNTSSSRNTMEQSKSSKQTQLKTKLQTQKKSNVT